MADFQSSKNLASIGALLLFLSFIPVVGIIGLILVFVGMKGLSEHYKEPSIYQNALWGLVFGIIAMIALTAGIVLAAIGVIAFGLGSILIIFGVLIAVFIFYLIAARYLKQAFDTLAQRSGEHSFETAGRLLWIGAILTIIFVGLFLIFIAWIFATIGFFSMKSTEQPQPYTYAPPPPPTSTASPAQATRFCPNCGAPVDPNATFCPNCGKPLT